MCQTSWMLNCQIKLSRSRFPFALFSTFSFLDVEEYHLDLFVFLCFQHFVLYETSFMANIIVVMSDILFSQLFQTFFLSKYIGFSSVHCRVLLLILAMTSLTDLQTRCHRFFHHITQKWSLLRAYRTELLEDIKCVNPLNRKFFE